MPATGFNEIAIGALNSISYSPQYICLTQYSILSLKRLPNCPQPGDAMSELNCSVNIPAGSLEISSSGKMLCHVLLDTVLAIVFRLLFKMELCTEMKC